MAHRNVVVTDDELDEALFGIIPSGKGRVMVPKVLREALLKEARIDAAPYEVANALTRLFRHCRLCFSESPEKDEGVYYVSQGL